MPIHVNLLAEAQAAEDLRRRDPVKRAIYIGTFLVVLALVWSSKLKLEVVINNSDLTQMQARVQSRTNEWQVVLDNQKKVADARAKLAALQQLNSARFLQGNFMNALQQLNLDGIQLARVRVNQTYSGATVAPGAPGDNDSHATAARAAKATEKIVLTLDARDVSASPGDQVNKFKAAVAGQDYFKMILNKTNSVQLTSLASPQSGADGKAFVLFTLECNLPPQTR